MKLFKKIVKLFSLIILIGLAGLFTWRPLLFKVLRYRTPDAATYKIFPQEFMRPSDTPFNFVRPAVQRNDLDTLHVLDAADSSITLSDYIKEGNINVFIVIRNDSVLYERYNKGYTDSTLTTVFSMAKSMLSVAVGKAIADGKIKDLDDKITSYIPDLKINVAFKDVTVRHLLAMKSGLEFKDTEGNFIDALLSDEAKYYYTTDMRKELLKVRLVNEPGTIWKYKSIDPILLGWLLKNATGKTVAQYFEANIWRKIGTKYAASWGLDHKSGLANTASRFQATAIDIAKIGKLYLQHGHFGANQVLPEDWVVNAVNIGNEIPVPLKGWQRSAHHYLWWIPQTGNNGDYAAEGMLGQRLYIDPLTNTIIVELADKGAGHYPYRKISRYLYGKKFSYTEQKAIRLEQN